MEGARAHPSKVGAKREQSARRDAGPAVAYPVPGTKAPNAFLVGVSRAPLVIAIPPNMSAAFRAQAQARDTGAYEEILSGLLSISDLALDECEREDAPDHNSREAWLREGTKGFGGVIAPEFTDEQWARLREAARLVEAQTNLRKVTVEEIIVAGAMSLLDWFASTRKDAAEAIGADVVAYARLKLTFAEPERGTHDALQSPDTAPHR